MKHHLQVAAAIAVATTAAGCGHGVNAPAGAPKAAMAAAKTKMTINKPEAGENAATKPAAVESLWSGTIGGKNAHITLSAGGWVNASVGRADFSGSASGSWVTGSLRRPGQGADSVSLSGFGQSMSGFVGRDSASAHVGAGGWVSGYAGNRRLSVTVSRMSITGDMAGRRVWMSGTGVEPNEGAGLTAALLALLAAAE